MRASMRKTRRVVIGAVVIALLLSGVYWAAAYAWGRRVQAAAAGPHGLAVGPDGERCYVFAGRITGWAYRAPFALLVLHRDCVTFERRSLMRRYPERTFARANLENVRLRRGLGSLSVRFEGGGFRGPDYSFLAMPGTGLGEALADLGWIDELP